VGTAPEYVLARTEFAVAAKAVASVVAFVTAQQSPLCTPDPRLKGNDYGACVPHGGSSQSKLLGAYKLYVNGGLVGMGPGRRINQTQGVDAIDVTSVVLPGATNAVGLAGFHTNAFVLDAPRLLLLLRVTYADGSSADTATAGGPTSQWRVLGADRLFSPGGSTGGWAGKTGMPQEDLNRTTFPDGWATAGFDATAAGFGVPTAAPPFVLPLRNKPTRPVAVFSRTAVSVTAWGGGGGASESESCTGCYVIDFGRELQGGVNLTFADASANHPVTVLLSEELTSDGVPLVPMKTGNNFTSRWTLQEGDNVEVMQHEYMEFRYAMVKNSPSILTVDTALAWVVRCVRGAPALCPLAW
jgi:hypothetical protein